MKASFVLKRDRTRHHSGRSLRNGLDAYSHAELNNLFIAFHRD